MMLVSTTSASCMPAGVTVGAVGGTGQSDTARARLRPHPGRVAAAAMVCPLRGHRVPVFTALSWSADVRDSLSAREHHASYSSLRRGDLRSAAKFPPIRCGASRHLKILRRHDSPGRRRASTVRGLVSSTARSHCTRWPFFPARVIAMGVPSLSRPGGLDCPGAGAAPCRLPRESLQGPSCLAWLRHPHRRRHDRANRAGSIGNSSARRRVWPPRPAVYRELPDWRGSLIWPPLIRRGPPQESRGVASNRDLGEPRA